MSQEQTQTQARPQAQEVSQEGEGLSRGKTPLQSNQWLDSIKPNESWQ